MAIRSLDDYLAAPKQKIVYFKYTSVVCVAGKWHTLWNLSGVPGAGTFGRLVVANASINGRVCTDSDDGFPDINAFAPGAQGYLSGFTFSNNVSGRLQVYDRIWEAGMFPVTPVRMINLTTDACTYQYRVPLKTGGGVAWNQIEAWYDVSIAIGAAAVTLAIKYINQDGVAKTSQATPTAVLLSGAMNAMITGRTEKIMLAIGDEGVQRITDISIGGAATTGTVSVYLMRPLCTGRIATAYHAETQNFEKLGLPMIDASVALAIMFAADGAATTTPDCMLEITNK